MSRVVERQEENRSQSSTSEVSENLAGLDGVPNLAAAIEALDFGARDEVFASECGRLQLLFGDHHLIWCARVRRLIQQRRFEEAQGLARGRAVDDYDYSGRLAQAECLYDAHATDDARLLFDQLITSHPDNRNVRTSYGKRLLANGLLVQAEALLRPVTQSFGEGTKSRALCEKVAALFSLLTRLEGHVDPDADARILAMKHAILHFRNRVPGPRSTNGLGRLTLVTGGLGPGGAERQLTRVAIEFERARKVAGEVAGIALDRPVEVVVRSHSADKQNDFYLSELHEAGVEVRQINDFQPISAKRLGVDDPELLLLLDYLPSSVNYGVKRLAPHLAEQGTETVSAWQDGACLFTGLAALIAGVPQVQLAIRGLPPSMRRHMFRPEYEVLYRAMAQVPGVSFLSNNVSAARAYAEWLEIPLNRFAIVYNGVEPMTPAGSVNCEALWSRFADATPDAEQTVGGVFRFDTDKQPLQWIRFARRYLKRHPKARFVLVGGGRLQSNAEQLAAELGIADRILFTGRSNRVGFWMSKMDALVLLSRYEGLPNVLIEAQYMGVRVITTPAGGAAECVLEGITGHVLDCAEKPDLERAVELTHELVTASADRALFAHGGVGHEFLEARFSIPHMLAQFVTCTKRGSGSDMPAEAVSEEAERAAA